MLFVCHRPVVWAETLKMLSRPLSDQGMSCYAAQAAFPSPAAPARLPEAECSHTQTQTHSITLAASIHPTAKVSSAQPIFSCCCYTHITGYVDLIHLQCTSPYVELSGMGRCNAHTVKPSSELVAGKEGRWGGVGGHATLWLQFDSAQ